MKRVRGKAAVRHTINACGGRSAAADIRKSGLRPAAVAAGLAAAVLAGGAFLAPAAHAQATADTVNANIPAGPLDEALIRFAAQAGVTVQADPAIVRGKTSPSLKGATTVEDGFRRLLAGSGYGIARTSSGYALVAQSAAAPASPSDSTTLPALQVTANSGMMPGGLAEPYAGGQVARGGSVGLLGSRDVMDTPFSTVNYTSELIENQQARTAADTLINDASVRLTTGSNGFDDTFQIRGYAVGAGDVGFNGMFGLVSSNRVPAQIVERIELLKGPGALANGIAPGGSIGGGINILAKRAGDQPLTRVTTTYMSDANLTAHVDVGRRFGENKEWGVRFNGLMRNGEASVDGGNLRSGLGSLAVDYRGERLRWSMDAISQRDDTDNFRPQISLLSTTTAIPSPPDARSNWYPGTTLVQKDVTVASNVEVDLTDSLTAYAGIGYRKGENDQTFPSSTAAVNALGNFTVRNAYYDSYSRTVTGTAGARWRFETGPVHHSLNVGYTGFKRDEGNAYIQSAGSVLSNIYNPSALPAITAARTSARKSTETTLTSFALADTLSVLDDRVMLTLGVRRQKVHVDSFSTTTGLQTGTYDASATSPLAGFVVKPLSNVSVYANYAEGLTRGTVVGAGYANTGAVLAPYKSNQYEAGVKVDWGSITTTAAVFQLTKPNSIRNAANELAYDGEQRNRGLELSVYGEILPGLRGMASAAFMDPKLTRTATAAVQGNDAAGVPDKTFSAGLDWETPWVEGLALNGRVIYTSGSYLTDANTLRFDGWTRFDIGARYAATIVGTPVTFRANVENLFDKDYWLTTGTYVTVGAPRTVLLSASADF
ncbi:iron complex outermembrane recepter protein [Azospirillum oryzae]|uniref:Iron complex outermembrane recepter protein n=1 Tax=Azospirillum oryzae TaxID=286727 RepID=A0A1X7HM80_9PROT|nr:TonB-dependent receptor [Azospirillum oryzae]SMF88399.1 iron complex outermembrane recepter protein [Azospirillum oryzae]